MKNNQQPVLRICLVSYRSNPHCGGQGVYLKNLSRALKDLGHDVTVVSGPPDPQLDDDITLHRLPCLDLYNPENPFRIPTMTELSNPINFIEWLGVSTGGFPEPFTFGMRAYLFVHKRRRFYDIIHDNQSLSYGIWALSRFTPTVATIHHPITIDRSAAVNATPRFWKKLKHLRWHSFIGMQKRVAQSLSHIITVSACAQADIGAAFNIPDHRFRTIHNGINTRFFYPMPEIEREKNRLIVTNSADIPLKGLHYLMGATAEIAKSRPIHLVVVGERNKTGAIGRLIQALGIEDLVTFTGRISHRAFVRQYARASVAVVPSVYEGFGLPAGEAMACGVPVISTTGGALPEVVGKAGIQVPAADKEALVRAITHLLDHPHRAAELGRAGYKRIQQHFTWRKAAQRTIAAYREVIHDYHRS